MTLPRLVECPKAGNIISFIEIFECAVNGTQPDATVGADQETPAPSSLSRHRSTVLQWGEICYVSVFRLATDMEGGRKR